MIKRFLLFVLLISPGAVSDALLALKASTVPDGTISVNEQAAKDKVRGKQALEPSEDITAAAAGEERAPISVPVLEGHLKDTSEKMYDWISRMARKSAFWKKAKSALTKEEKALQKVAWRKVEEASCVTETAWRNDFGEKLAEYEKKLQNARAAWDKDKAARKRIEAARETNEAAWEAKLAATGDEKIKSLSLLARSDLSKDIRMFKDLEAEWQAKKNAWIKTETELKADVLSTKVLLVNKLVKTYQPQFEKLMAHGITREVYQNLLGLESSTIAKYRWKRDLITSYSVDELKYAKYLYFDKYLENEGELSKLEDWAVKFV
uniref:RxLR effector candidate protein n=1 Tax=Peronospora matthiolae TaxID=2874970 RepID=A0AAV1TWI5_9STRA